MRELESNYDNQLITSQTNNILLKVDNSWNFINKPAESYSWNVQTNYNAEVIIGGTEAVSAEVLEDNDNFANNTDRSSPQFLPSPSVTFNSNFSNQKISLQDTFGQLEQNQVAITQSSNGENSASYSYNEGEINDNISYKVGEIKANGVGKVENNKIGVNVGIEGALGHASGTTGRIGSKDFNVSGNIDSKVGAFELGASANFNGAKGASIGGIAEAYAIKGEYGLEFQVFGTKFNVKYTAIGGGVGGAYNIVVTPTKVRLKGEVAALLGGGISIEAEANPQ
ncbi:hypothetical protein [Anaerospora sp.]|uniref:hypothetical protein n=1 Tax=Anaerospora sp. TaxID=1960278 RepID=UPI0028A02271|nr:hypothetical protein [Anaerospora sp.]